MRTTSANSFQQHRSDRLIGFTLVELLVVIAIIGILIGILLPVVSRARENANDIYCRSNLHQIAIATRMYENDYGDVPPDAAALGGAAYRRGRGETNPSDPTSLPETLGMGPLYYNLKYIANDKVWMCPSATDTIQGFKNCYAWALFYHVADNPNAYPIPGKDQSDTLHLYHSTKLRGLIKNENVFWVYDNYAYYPALSGLGRSKTDPVSTIPSTLQRYPHQYQAPTRSGAKKKGSINICFIDGQVGVGVFNNDLGKNEIFRSP